MNIYDLISRAQKLREETKLDSVSPDRVGALCEDTLKYINEFQLLASSPSLHKIYASVSAMQADKSPKSDITGKALKPGQLVVIVPANQSDATAGDVYRYDGPSGNTSAWTFVAKIGAVSADAELNATSANPVQNKAVTEKLTELESEVGPIPLGESCGVAIFGSKCQETYQAEVGKAVSADGTKTKIRIKAGQQFSVLIDSEVNIKTGLFSLYGWNDNGDKKVIAQVSINTTFNFVLEENINYVGIYISSAEASGFFNIIVNASNGLIDDVNLLDIEIKELSEEVMSHKNAITNIENDIYKNVDIEIDPSYFALSGVIKNGKYISAEENDEYAPYRVTDFIELGNVISISCFNCMGIIGFNSIALYGEKSNDGFIVGFSESDYTIEDVGSMYPSAKYVRFGSRYTTTEITSSSAMIRTKMIDVEKTDEYVDVNSFAKLNNAFDNSLYFERLFLRNAIKKVICVGDSVTKGLVQDYPNSGTFEGCSYPAFLANIIDCDVVNGGVSGITTESWYKNELSKYNFSDCQIVIIELGHNDELENTIDIDVKPYDSPDDYAETPMGYYCRLVESIKSKNKNMLIFIGSPALYIPISGKAKAIKSIAEYYGLPLINYNDSSHYNLLSAEYHGKSSSDSAIDAVHFNRLGYLYKAMFAYYEIVKYMIENKSVTNSIMSGAYK